MADYTYRIGDGTKKTFHGDPPTKRADGSPYVHGPEDYFLWFITNDPSISPNDPGGDPFSGITGIAVELDPASKAFVGEDADGNPDPNNPDPAVFDVDSDGVPGVWRVWYKTVDVDPENGKKLYSAASNVLTIDILPPLAEPLPPVIS